MRVLMLLILVQILIINKLNAQSNSGSGRIGGKIVAENKKPVEFANITLHKTKDSSFVKAALSDESGVFELESIADDNYYIKVTSINCETFVSPEFAITPDFQTKKFDDILLKTKIGALAEVNISSKKQFVERQLDKIVVNVENSIVAAGNSALEVLERSPGVQVNQETSINLKGKAGVIVQIDGKNSPLSGPDLINYLKGIPSSTIQTIEIIMNPSARYDSEGNAGIINIKFKKDQRQGFNGSATLSYGHGELPKPSGSMNFNWRQKAWNVFGSAAHSRPTQFTRFFINRKFFDEAGAVQSIFVQNSYTRQPIISENGRLGIDYYLGKKSIFGILLNGNWTDNAREGATNSLISRPDNSVDYTTKTGITLDEHRFNGFGNLNFKHIFNTKATELTADLDYGKFNSLNMQDILNQNFLPDGFNFSNYRLETFQSGNIEVKSFKADFVHPYSAKGKIEAGVKTSLVTSDNDVRFYNILQGQQELDKNRSNNFIYKENVNAAYGSFSKTIKKIEFQAGLRFEHTRTNGIQLATNERFSRNYIYLFPNAVLNWNQSEPNQFSISYSRRIDRPSYRQLNPFRVFVDSYTYVVGDPALRPVLTNNIELSYTFKSKYITSMGFTQSKQTITDVFIQDDSTKISFQIPANIRDFYQVNLGLYLPFQIGKKWSTAISGNIYWNKYTGPFLKGNLVNEYTAWDANLTNNFNLGKDWSAELNAYYQAQNVWGLFTIKELAQVSIGVQKTTKNKKSTFKLSASDLFLTNHIAVVVKYENMDFFTNRTWDSRVVSLSYTYRFGKSTVAKVRVRNSGVEDEKKRAS